MKLRCLPQGLILAFLSTAFACGGAAPVDDELVAQTSPALGAAKDQSFLDDTSWGDAFVAGGICECEHWNYPRYLADVNGDHKTDLVSFGDEGVYAALSNGSSFGPVTLILREFGRAQTWGEKHLRTFADINGDGREDIVAFSDAGIWTSLGSASGFGPARFVLQEFGGEKGWTLEKHVRLLADVNADGKKDIVGFGDDGVWLSLATGGGNFASPRFVVATFGANQGWDPKLHVRTMADVNGDGREDIVAFGYHGVWTALSTGTGFTAPTLVLQSFGNGTVAGGWRNDLHIRTLADVDGDGKKDIIGFGGNGVYVAKSSGNGFSPATLALADFDYLGHSWQVHTNPRYVTDLNGDGYPDIVGYGDGAIYRSLGGPAGFGPVRLAVYHLMGGLHTDTDNLVGDFNGDGKTDLLAFYYENEYVALSSDKPLKPPPVAPDLVTVPNITSSSIAITWRDRSNDETAFSVIWGEGTNNLVHTVYLDANTTGTTLDSLHANTLYCFIVQSENSHGVSPTQRFCEYTSGSAPPPPPPPPPPSKPDLFVQNSAVSPSFFPEPGQKITYSWLECNAGGTAAGAYQWRLSLDGVVLKTGTTAQLAASSCFTNSFDLAGGASEGEHQFDIVLDVTNAVSESNEGNNANFAQFHPQ